MEHKEKSYQTSIKKSDNTTCFFTNEELALLDAARRSVDLDHCHVVYCVYENPFAKSGGIFAVAESYCRTLRKHKHRDVVIISPFHTRLESMPSADEVKRFGDPFNVTFDRHEVVVELFEHRSKGNRWLLVRADGFFEATGTDPYRHAEADRLLRDSLFFCKAIPHVLRELKLQEESLVIHLQDWETAATALTIKEAMLSGLINRAAVVVTSHNPYDHPVSPDQLATITDRHYRSDMPAYTVYQYMLPLADAPISTVSGGFARELTTDPLMTEYFADHLQGVFRSRGLVGIDNGIFGEARQPFSKEAVKSYQKGILEPIATEKKEKRSAMLQAVAQYEDDRIFGHIDGGEGRPLVELPDDIPVFFMFGRLDPGQKGFDVFSRAIEQMPVGAAKYILAPSVAGAPEAYVSDLLKLAEIRKGEVVVYPFRMEQCYLEIMAGATYAVMPSLYEPFGAATEPYLAGTPVVARRTGGLAQQVLDRKTGILYRETLTSGDQLGEEWQSIQQAADPYDRKQVPLYQAMVEGLRQALTTAVGIYSGASETSYDQLLGRLYEQAKRFDWQRAADQYLELYRAATS